MTGPDVVRKVLITNTRDVPLAFDSTARRHFLDCFQRTLGYCVILLL
jgi:hypothetical protein